MQVPDKLNLISKINDFLVKTIEELVKDTAFLVKVVSICRETGSHMNNEDIKTMLLDSELTEAVKQANQYNGNDYELIVNKALKSLVKKYEVNEIIADSCCRIIWQAIKDYLKQKHPDIYDRIKADTTEATVKKPMEKWMLLSENRRS